MRHVLVLAPLALLACADPGYQGVAGVREAEASEVAACQLLVNIRALPSVYGPVLGAQGLAYTRNQVMADAQKAGANTVVFDKVAPGQDVYELRATAYRC